MSAKPVFSECHIILKKPQTHIDNKAFKAQFAIRNVENRKIVAKGQLIDTDNPMALSHTLDHLDSLTTGNSHFSESLNTARSLAHTLRGGAARHYTQDLDLAYKAPSTTSFVSASQKDGDIFDLTQNTVGYSAQCQQINPGNASYSDRGYVLSPDTQNHLNIKKTLWRILTNPKTPAKFTYGYCDLPGSTGSKISAIETTLDRLKKAAENNADISHLAAVIPTDFAGTLSIKPGHPLNPKR